MNNNFYKLMLITQKGKYNTQKYINFLVQCIKGGVTSIQIREKNSSKTEIIKFVETLKPFLSNINIPMVINDDFYLANDVNADGVHLGSEDGNILKARKILGDKKIIGVTVNSENELKHANHLPIDYIGISSIFPSKNKKNIKYFWGIDKLRRAIQISKHKVVAIGGINIDNLHEISSTGIDGIAGIGLFHESENPFLDTKRFFNIIDK